MKRIALGAVLALAAAAGAQQAQPDPKATALLREVHAQRCAWSPDFPGFEAKAAVTYKGKEHRGAARAGKNLTAELDLPDAAAARWAVEALQSIAAHRRATPFEGGDGRYPLTLGPADDHPAGRLVRLNDPGNSTYRVRDGQILQITRSAGPRLRFTIDMLENTRTDAGKVLPRVFTVAYFAAGSGELQRSETFWEGYRKVGGHYLPEIRRQVTAEDGGTEVAVLRLEEHRLLAAGD